MITIAITITITITVAIVIMIMIMIMTDNHYDHDKDGKGDNFPAQMNTDSKITISNLDQFFKALLRSLRNHV